MAKYTTTVHTPWPPEKAFDYVADFRNLRHWDPGVSESVMVEGAEPAVGTAYDVSLTGTKLRYVTKEHVAPKRSVLEANSKFFYSYDVLTVNKTANGANVTYDATLKLRSVSALFNPLLGLFFNRIGDKAAAGLEKALDGTRAEQ